MLMSVMPFKPSITSTHNFQPKVTLSTLNLQISTLKHSSFDFSAGSNTARAGH